MDLTRRQIAEGSHEEMQRFPQHVWLHESHEHGSQSHHGAPRETLQSASTHNIGHAVLLHLPCRTTVQRLHQVKGYTVRVRPFEDFRVELYSVGQVIVQVRVSLLDARERLTQRDSTQRRQHNIQPQVHENPKREETIQGSDERYKGNNRLHSHSEEEDSEA